MKRMLMAALAAFAIASPAAADDFKPAVIFDTGGKFDKSFNEAAYNGAEQFKKETGIAYAEFEVTNESQREQSLRMIVQAHAPAIHVASAGERASNVEKLVGRQHRADARPAREHAHVLQPRERRRLALPQHLDHLTDKPQLGADAVGVRARFRLQRKVLAERSVSVGADELADLVEFQQLKRMSIHRHGIDHGKETRTASEGSLSAL